MNKLRQDYDTDSPGYWNRNLARFRELNDYETSHRLSLNKPGTPIYHCFKGLTLR